jgi:hypothetical protein
MKREESIGVSVSATNPEISTDAPITTENSRNKWLEWKRRIDPLHYLSPKDRQVAYRRVAMDMIADRIVVLKDGHVQEIMTVPLPRPRPDLGVVRGLPEFAATRYRVWQALHRSGDTLH